MTPLRFCMVTTFYPPYNFGGDGIAVQHLARALVRRGHSVTVVHDTDAHAVLSGRRPQDAGQSSWDEGVRVVPLRSQSPFLSTLLTQQTGRPGIKAGALKRALAEDFDVIHFHNISLIGGPGILAYGSGIKLYTAHEHWLVCPTHILWRENKAPCYEQACLHCVLQARRPPQAWRYTGLLERMSKHVDCFIAGSEFSRQKHREFGHKGDMSVLSGFLPDVVTPVSSERPHERPYFLFVGRFEHVKGAGDVIPLFEGPGTFDLLLAGKGPARAEWEALAHGNPRVRFLGLLTAAELDVYYRHAIGVVVPARGFETFGLVVIEAFRHGTPVIARRLGPLPEIVAPGGGGVLFESSAELRQAIERLANDPAERDAMSCAARASFVERWSEDVIVPRYLELVERVRREKQRRESARPTRAVATPRADHRHAS